MTNTNKLTNKSALLYAIDTIGDSNPEVVAKLQKMVEQLEHKNAAPKKLTAQQEKNAALRQTILDFLSVNADIGFTCADLIKNIPELAGDSNQHVSALMRGLKLENLVEVYSEKRRTYFRAVREG